MPIYIRLTDYKSSDEKEQEFFNPENRYEAKQEDFSKISIYYHDRVENRDSIFNLKLSREN